MNILYLNHDFFEYDRAIEAQLCRMGHKVLSYQYVKMANCLEVLQCKKGRGDAYQLACLKRQKNILKELEQKRINIDAVLVTAGHMMEEDTLITLRKMYPKARFVWYLWDNTASLSCYEKNKHHFDVVVSYDIIEAKEKKMEFLPDFYTYEEKNIKKVFDLSYVGTYRRERLDVIEQIVQKSSLNQSFIYLYQKNEYRIIDRLYQAYAKIMHKSENLENEYCFETMLSYQETIKIMSQSRSVLDICHPFQTGLSMRPFEAMAVRSKLITTNKNIVKYDFYNPHNIWIIDIDNIEPIPEHFIQSEYEELPNDMLKKYSIVAWCQSIERYLFTGERDCD